MRYAVDRWQDRWERQAGRMFLVGGRSGIVSTAAADSFVCQLWNPDTVRSLWVVEFSYSTSNNPTVLDGFRLVRTSTQGTATQTITPDGDNHFERQGGGPDTGALLLMADFTPEPTVALPALYRLTFPITGFFHSMTWLFPEGIRVPPGSGLGIANTTEAMIATDVSYRFYE